MAGADAVRACIAAADDEHILARRGNGDGFINGVAFAAMILLRQELHGEVNAFKLAAGNLEVARLLGATAEQDGVVVLGERFNRDVHADVRVGEERDAFRLHLLDAAINDMLLELEVRNTVTKQSADAVILLVDRDGVTRAAKLLRSGEP